MSEGKKSEETIVMLPSVAMKQVRTRLDRLRGSEAAVLFMGEPGTGKLTLARELIAGSPWADAPVLTINADEIPEHDARAELLGGAVRSGQIEGALSAAHGGTLILCHAEYLPHHVQISLLRFLETGRYRRAGGMREEHSEVRILATVGPSLARRVVHGQFRRDLYLRLSGSRVVVPPLRVRSNDTALLAEEFCAARARALGFEARLSPESVQLLTEVPLPGNIRELRMHVEEGLLEHGPGEIPPAALVSLRRESGNQVEEESARYGGDYPGDEFDALNRDKAKLLTLAEAEAEHILRVLAVSDGNKTRAARTLGVARSTMIRKLDDIRANGARPYADAEDPLFD